MLVKEVLSLLLEKNISFSSTNFIRDFRTRGFSMFNLKLCGLWLLLYADVDSELSRSLSFMSPRITQLSLNGKLILYAWPYDTDCHVVHLDC